MSGRKIKTMLATDGAQMNADKKRNSVHLCAPVPHLWLNLLLCGVLAGCGYTQVDYSGESSVAADGTTVIGRDAESVATAIEHETT